MVRYNNMKKLIFLVLSVVLILSACSRPATDTSTPLPSTSDTTVSTDEPVRDDGTYVDEGELKVRHFKVGKADALLIRTRTQTFLIDTGEADDSQKILDYLAEKGIKKLDYILLSTYDRDCYGGAAAIINAVEVGMVIMPEYDKDNADYVNLVDVITKKSVPIRRLSGKMTIELDDATLVLEGARFDSFLQNQDENASIIVSLTHGDIKMLFASAIKSERISAMLQSGELGEYDYLKVPSFGVMSSNISDFFNAVNPKYASISCSDKNPPDAELIKLLIDKGTDVYETRKGNVKITSDGSSIEIRY